MKLRKKHKNAWKNVKSFGITSSGFGGSLRVIPYDWIDFLEYVMNDTIEISFNCDKCGNTNYQMASLDDETHIDGYIVGQYIMFRINLSCDECHFNGDYRIKITQREIDYYLDVDAYTSATGDYSYAWDNVIFKAEYN